MLATPEGLRLFSIDKTIINNSTANAELKYSTSNPLSKPTVIPKSKLKFKNAVCELNRFSIFEAFRATKELTRKITK